MLHTLSEAVERHGLHAGDPAVCGATELERLNHHLLPVPNLPGISSSCVGWIFGSLDLFGGAEASFDATSACIDIDNNFSSPLDNERPPHVESTAL